MYKNFHRQIKNLLIKKFLSGNLIILHFLIIFFFQFSKTKFEIREPPSLIINLARRKVFKREYACSRKR